MKFSRCPATVLCFLAFGLAAHGGLFVAAISTRTYTLNGRGEIAMHPGNQREFVDVAAQNSSLSPKSLVLAYDTVADALEVVRRDDGTVVSTVMTFVGTTDVLTAGKDREYRQSLLALSGTDTPIAGSVDGPIHIGYDGSLNIIAYRWEGDFQYSIPGDKNTPNRVVHGHFVLGDELKTKATP